MLAVVNGVDITEYINTKSYKVNADKDYESWLDGNRREHRIYTRTRIEGSFEVALYGKDNMLTQNFLDLWEGAVDNEVVTMGVFVQNTNRMETIEAYYEFTGKSHRKMLNGNYCDVLTVKITER
jgi:hypothetical protein